MRVYISADYSEDSGDRDVVDILHLWAADKLHKVNFIDTAQVRSGSVSNHPDCRICDLKAEFNRQINVSSSVIVIIGDKTAQRTAGSQCNRNEKNFFECMCTPYKQNSNGQKYCKVINTTCTTDNVGNINSYSYIRHEFEQSKKRGKKIIVLYNSLHKQYEWIPNYMDKYYAIMAEPFWIKNSIGNKVGNYEFIKKALGYE